MAEPTQAAKDEAKRIWVSMSIPDILRRMAELIDAETTAKAERDEARMALSALVEAMRDNRCAMSGIVLVEFKAAEALVARWQPVDPLLLEARRLCAEQSKADAQVVQADEFIRGKWDEGRTVCLTMSALRRGIELAKVQP